MQWMRNEPELYGNTYRLAFIRMFELSGKAQINKDRSEFTNTDKDTHGLRITFDQYCLRSNLPLSYWSGCLSSLIGILSLIISTTFMLYFFHLCFIVCLNCANFLYMYWYILPSCFLSLSISLLLPFHIHCSPFSLQPCEQGKKLKRIHWVANIGTALKFLEGRKVRVHRLLFMFFFLSFFLNPPAPLPAHLEPRGRKYWILTSCDPFLFPSRLSLSSRSHIL